LPAAPWMARWSSLSESDSTCPAAGSWGNAVTAVKAIRQSVNRILLIGS
jgi:hypothetical protein